MGRDAAAAALHGCQEGLGDVTMRNAECETRNTNTRIARQFRIPHSTFRIALLAGALISMLDCGSPAPDAPTVIVTIPRRATFDAAVDSLVAHGVVRHPTTFYWYARLHGLPGELKSGTYGFHADERWSDLVEALKVGRGALLRWTVPEGLTLREIADLAQTQLGVPRDSFLAAASEPETLRRLGIVGTAEGYLYPTTYTVRVRIGAGELVRLMTDQFIAHWVPEWETRLDTLHMTRHQLVTLASIIEAEVRYAPDAEYVSAVYHNRLRKGMRLEADPTVIYAYGRRLSRVYEKNLRIRSPYNTYLVPGLPPGPISQPDSASIAAALYPARVPFLFFVAQPDGKHIFSVTYREHQAAIVAVRRMRSAARAPRPPGR